MIIIIQNISASYLLLFLLLIPGFTSSYSVTPYVRQQHNSIEAISIEGLPVAIDKPYIVNRATSKIKYSVRNLSNVGINTIEVRFIIADKTGKIKMSQNEEAVLNIGPQENAENSFYLDEKIDPNDVALLITWKVIGNTGVWSVDSRQIIKLINSRLSKKTAEPVAVAYTPNIKLSDNDKAEIIRLTLELILQNHRLLNFISFEQSKYIHVSSENINVKLNPHINGFSIIELNPQQIQEEADKLGKIMYFHFLQTEIEGSIVRISIEYSRAVGSKSSNFLLTPCCGGFTFEFYRMENGKWIAKRVSNFKI